jgi:hypothetical protein
MTSGQESGQDGGGPAGQPGGAPDQAGPPQGWNAPPIQQPYGQQYPGYGPAPSAPTGYGAPTPMERPVTVRAGIGALVASLILGIISSIATFADIDHLVARALAQSGSDVEVTDDVLRSAIIVGGVATLVFVALNALFLWFAWQGRNWARIVIWVLGGLGVLSGVAGLGTGSTVGGFLTSLGVFQFLLTAVGIVLLALKPSNEWYRYRGWQRATRQG